MMMKCKMRFSSEGLMYFSIEVILLMLEEEMKGYAIKRWDLGRKNKDRSYKKRFIFNMK